MLVLIEKLGALRAPVCSFLKKKGSAPRSSTGVLKKKKSAPRSSTGVLRVWFLKAEYPCRGWGFSKKIKIRGDFLTNFLKSWVSKKFIGQKSGIVFFLWKKWRTWRKWTHMPSRCALPHYWYYFSKPSWGQKQALGPWLHLQTLKKMWIRLLLL